MNRSVARKLLLVLLGVTAITPLMLRAQAPARPGRAGQSATTRSGGDWRRAPKNIVSVPQTDGARSEVALPNRGRPDRNQSNHMGDSETSQRDRDPDYETANDASDDEGEDRVLSDHRSAHPDPRAGGKRLDLEPRAGGFSDPAFIKGNQIWREYSLAPYTSRLASLPRPEQSVVDWILRRTGPETWNGADVAVLSATRSRLRVFHRPEVQSQVAEVVERFTRPVQSQVSLRVEIVTCTDLDWRSGLAHLLRPAAIGPDGQQLWVIPQEDASLLRERLRRDGRATTLAQQPLLAHNGQAATIDTTRPVNYISGLGLESGLYLSYQPLTTKLNEGVKLTIEPLWAADGSGLDADVRLITRTVARLHNAHSVVPLSTGNQSAVVQVPEVAATSLHEAVWWPESQVLLLTAGVLAGNASSKRSTFSFATVPSELLILVEFDRPLGSRTSSHRSATSQL